MTPFFLVYYEWVLVSAIIRDMIRRKRDILFLIVLLVVSSLGVAAWSASQPRHFIPAEVVLAVCAATNVVANMMITSRVRRLEGHSVVTVAILNVRQRMAYRIVANIGAFAFVSTAACLSHVSITAPVAWGCLGVWFFGLGFFLALEPQFFAQKMGRVLPSEDKSSQPNRQFRVQGLPKWTSLPWMCGVIAFIAVGLGITGQWYFTHSLWLVFFIGYGVIPFVVLPAQSGERAAFGTMMGEPMATVVKAMVKRLAVVSGAALLPVILFPACLLVAVQAWLVLSGLALFFSVFVTLHYRVFPKNRAEMALGFSGALAVLCVTISSGLLVLVALFRLAYLWRRNQQRLWMALS
ncbi:hypothetical protein FOH24_04880 [Acetobacter tropicalis]|uniref:hypothetical protein n=1 Tax=Acetobacter tropicalis TaxID=104102 RepID=UPI00055552BD|nr:hypothetical protein [Acetobacter tropicalis]KAA8390080.1 hypothetical protein FOH22_04290 [Acetobacter tropicalis]KAA8392010.1 hypothetical protein FOH24_04880 [Acetobacter tropicalis]MBC9007643.1 hypothetical protein [Acetobacter tropicalis]MDO8172824.1 hypothetical protein [Acetobacter tropicalis]